MEEYDKRYSLAWTVTLVIGKKDNNTGFFQWGQDRVLEYPGAGHGVLFESLAWHRSVIPAEQGWPFECIKFSFFFMPASNRTRRAQARARST